MKHTKIHITGHNGFLAKKIIQNIPDNIKLSDKDFDIYFDLGATIFTSNTISQEQCKLLFDEMIEKINIWKNLDDKINILFASSTGVNDISLEHDNSTCYNLYKLTMENWLMNNKKNFTILRIGTIYSTNPNDYKIMKTDRVPFRIRNKNFKDIPMIDEYLDIKNFIKKTLYIIENITAAPQIVEYELDELSIIQLSKIIPKE